MSSSIAIAIPQRKHQSQDPVSHHHQHHRHSASSSSSAGDSSCSAASSYNAATSFFPSSTPPSGLSMLSEKQKSKLPVGVEIPTPTTASPPSNARSGSTSPISPRRPSLLGSSLSKSEYTVVNLGHEDGPPRLVTCVKSSQGFDWNLELFLPSYADYDANDLEHRPDPVFDIVLTDEEAAAILPQ